MRARRASTACADAPARAGDGWPAPRGRRIALAAAGRADLASVRAHVRAACAGGPSDAGAPAATDADACDALALAADEVCTNVVAHAYPAAPGPLTVDVAVENVAVGNAAVGRPGALVCRVTVVDAGRPFDPTAVAEPDVDAPLERRAAGGLGLLIVRRSVDALRYERVGACNVVTLEKRCAAPRARPAGPAPDAPSPA